MCFVPFVPIIRPHLNFPLLRVLSALECLAEQVPVDLKIFLERYQPIAGNHAMVEGIECLQHLSTSTAEAIGVFQAEEGKRLKIIRDFQEGWSLYKANRYAKALPYLEAASPGKNCLGMPGRIQIEFGLGVCLIEAHQPTEAIPCFLHVYNHSTSPARQSRARFYLGIAQQEAGQYAEAIASLAHEANSRFLTSEETSQAKCLLGCSLFRMNQNAAVIAFFDPLLARDDLFPSHAANAHHIVGVCLHALHRDPEAIPHLIAAITSPHSIDIDKMLAHWLLGKIFFNNKQYREAIPHLKEAIDGLDTGDEHRRQALDLYNDALAATSCSCVVS